MTKIQITKGSGWYENKVGEVYEVIDPKVYGFRQRCDGVYYVDHSENSDEMICFVSKNDCDVLDEPVDKFDQFTDHIANLARRVSELERCNERLFQKVEMLTDDIVMLDDRTQTKVVTSSDVCEFTNYDDDEEVTKYIVFEKNFRKVIVLEAKKDVEYIANDISGNNGHAWEDYGIPGNLTVDFVINREKRTVVALTKLRHFPELIYSRGIAKCAPNDVFNADIGKAIALRRALKLAVPIEYTNAPQPEGVAAGDVIKGVYDSSEIVTYIGTIKKVTTDKFLYMDGGFDYRTTHLKVLDDTDREEYRI